MRVRKSVKNWSKIAIMKLEVVVFRVMRAVTINCKSTLAGLILAMIWFTYVLVSERAGQKIKINHELLPVVTAICVINNATF